MIQFYAPDIEETLTLPESESAHCCRVLRMKTGVEIYITDGKGHRFIAEITKENPSKTEVRIKEKLTFPPERNYKLTLAVAPTKNSERMEWMVEKAVEIGVDCIALLKCKRSERKFQRSERLMKIMASAMKQSLSTFMPQLMELTEFKNFVNLSSSEAQKFFGYCSEAFPRKEFVNLLQPGGDVVVMIGPEGDFTEDEVEMAVKSGFVPVTFGNKRLRTETAGVFAVSAVNVINQLNLD